MIGHRRTVCAWLAGMTALALPARLLGVVETIDGTVTSEVQEFLPEQTNSDFAFKDLTETTQVLPLVATAQLTQSLDGMPISGSRANTIFSDPTLSVLPDPNEFGIDLVSISDAAGISYTGRCEATETRGITSLAEEIGAGNGMALEVESQFFVDGIILLVGRTGQTDIASSRANVVLSVQRNGNGQAPVTVLEAGLTLSGQSDGSAILTTSGALDAGNVIQVNLSNLIPELGPVHLLIIPNMAIPYTYGASVGEAFTLDARIAANIENGPRTGAAITLGVPLAEVAALINWVTGGQAGAVLEQLIAATLASSGPPLKPLAAKSEGSIVTVLSDAQPAGGNAPRCALLGIESLLAASGLGVLSLCRQRTVRHRGNAPPTRD